MLTIMYGRETDHSLVGDWDGDGVDTPGVFRGGPRLKAAGECAPLNEGRSRYTTDNANRVSLVIAERYGTSYAKFVNCHKQWDGSYYEEWQTPTRIGANGMATVGEPAAWHTYKTPTGSYSVTESFGVDNPGTDLDYRQLNSQSKWGGTRGVNYNQYFEGPKASAADEDMWAIARAGDYRLGVVINHNRPPDSEIVEGMGYAIFFHANKVATAGCVAPTENEVAMYMRTAQKGDRIIMGVRSHIFY